MDMDRSKRDANAVMDSHFAAVATMNVDTVMLDYGQDCIAINYLDGNTRAINGFDDLKTFIKGELEQATDPSIMATMKMITRQSVGDYVTVAFTADPAIPFASYTYITKDGMAKYVTGVQKNTARTENPWMPAKCEPSAQTKETMAVIENHMKAMGTGDVDIILADYAEDAIVISNLCEKPLVGHSEIRVLCQSVVSGQAIDANVTPVFLVKETLEELGLLVFELGPNAMGAETYLVKNGKIIFESAVFRMG